MDQLVGDAAIAPCYDVTVLTGTACAYLPVVHFEKCRSENTTAPVASDRLQVRLCVLHSTIWFQIFLLQHMQIFYQTRELGMSGKGDEKNLRKTSTISFQSNRVSSYLKQASSECLLHARHCN